MQKNYKSFKYLIKNHLHTIILNVTVVPEFKLLWYCQIGLATFVSVAKIF